MVQMVAAYQWHTETTWLGSFGAHSPCCKRLLSNCGKLLSHLKRTPSKVRDVSQRRKSVKHAENTYPDEFCDAVMSGITAASVYSLPPSPWVDVGATDGWADAAVAAAIAELSL